MQETSFHHYQGWLHLPLHYCSNGNIFQAPDSKSEVLQEKVKSQKIGKK